MPTSLSIASGKGGVGKTTVAINLAIVQAKISSCLLLDADMGMANAHILLGINPELTIKDFFDFCMEKKININKVVGVNEESTSEIKKSNLEIKNLFSKVGIFLLK